MFVDLTNQPCLVVGGGMVAYRKVKTLLDFDAKVSVVAEEICGELTELASQVNNGVEPQTKPLKKSDSRIQLYEKAFEENDCNGMTIVVAATDAPVLNHKIAQHCKCNGIMVNAVDQKEDCSFIFSSYVKEKNLVAAFSSGGNSPVLTQYLKEKETAVLTPFLGELNEYMGEIRESIIAEYENEKERKSAFQEIVQTAIERGELP